LCQAAGNRLRVNDFKGTAEAARRGSVLERLGWRMDFEILAGRALAMCAHPYATWRARSTRSRAFVVFAYMMGSYAAVLGLLFAR